ncbi:MAG: acyl-CoA thioesterase [Spirochaetota bacterium]|nr:acyl-CoA thioesterase [Spirochaetota bacterium]
MAREKYFKPIDGSPPPLRNAITRKVRFDELDPLSIMWHGNYASFFEEARVALGERYGIGYMDFIANNIIIPIKKFHVDYLAPLVFGETYTIWALLHYNPAARLDFEYQIFSKDGALMTTGCTIQMMLDTQKNILLAKPPFLEEFCQKWRNGLVQ